MDRASLWQQEISRHRPPQPLPARTDAVIIGGGLCGLLTAYQLRQRQVTDITVIDAGDMAGGVTAHTTAKITPQHGAVYQQLWRQQGPDAARLYRTAAREATAMYQQIIRQLGIDCDFTPAESVLYAADEPGIRILEREADILSRLGVSFTADQQTELPFSVFSALHTKDSAHIHPLKFAFGLTDYLQRQGVRFCPHTTAVGLCEDGVLTDRGTLHTPVAVITTHYPFWDMPGHYFARLRQERSYVVAAAGIPPIHGMYRDVNPRGYSFRGFSHGVLIGGGAHPTGVGDHRAFHQLTIRSAAWYPGRRIAAAWSAQDCMTPDHLPFIGRYPQADQPYMRVYLATGFNKWGMTTGMTAAAVLAGEITGAAPIYAPLFSPSRSEGKRPGFYAQNAKVLQRYIGGYCRIPKETLSALHPGEGKLLSVGGKRVGAYKRRDGRLFLVKPVCTHMGCMLEWNPAERSWDCPCHGSRFDYKGQPLNTPAFQPLERYKLSE